MEVAMRKTDKVWVTLTTIALVVYVLAFWLHVIHL
jgi:hypothetical protein